MTLRDCLIGFASCSFARPEKGTTAGVVMKQSAMIGDGNEGEPPALTNAEKKKKKKQ